jgi:ribosomal protein S26
MLFTLKIFPIVLNFPTDYLHGFFIPYFRVPNVSMKNSHCINYAMKVTIYVWRSYKKRGRRQNNLLFFLNN